MTKQADIARELGLSQATVSLALRRHTSIPQATRDKVDAVAKRLGYRVDPLLSALMAQRRGNRTATMRAKIALLTDTDSREGWRSVTYTAGCYAGAAHVAAQRGYLCEHFWLREPGIDGRRLSQILYTQNVHGLILAPLQVSTPPLQLDWDRFAAVSLDYSLSDPELHRVVDDHGYGMERIMEEVARCGYRRPGLVLRYAQDVRTHHNRLGAFLSLVHLYPTWNAVPPLILEGDSWSEEAFQAWVKRERPDVVLTEEQATTASLSALGMQVPRDIGLIFYHKQHPLPRLTGLEVDYQHVGRVTAQVLMRLIETNERGPTKVPTTTLVKAFVWHPGQTVRRPKAPRRASSP
jgi:LacI family transcriptional regulator